MDNNFFISLADYENSFKEFYTSRLTRCSLRELVEIEDNLSKLIDSDLFSDCILADEIIFIYDAVRDECVRRLADMTK